MIRDSRTLAKLKMKMKEENLGYMSDMALELAQMADDCGHATLAYLFRMAALEASTADGVATDRDDFPHSMTSH